MHLHPSNSAATGVFTLFQCQRVFVILGFFCVKNLLYGLFSPNYLWDQKDRHYKWKTAQNKDTFIKIHKRLPEELRYKMQSFHLPVCFGMLTSQNRRQMIHCDDREGRGGGDAHRYLAYPPEMGLAFQVEGAPSPSSSSTPQECTCYCRSDLQTKQEPVPETGRQLDSTSNMFSTTGLQHLLCRH